MFGIKKMLKRTILNASENYLPEYIDSLMNLYNKYGEELNEEELCFARKAYLDNVANASFDVFRVSSPLIYQRVLLVLQTPSLCGYNFDEEEDDRGMMAGKVYAVMYTAYNNKIAKPKECIAMNHLQHAIMDKALHILEEKISLNE